MSLTKALILLNLLPVSFSFGARTSFSGKICNSSGGIAVS